MSPRVLAVLHDERIPVGVLGDIADACRALSQNGLVWASVIDGRLCIVCDPPLATCGLVDPTKLAIIGEGGCAMPPVPPVDAEIKIAGDDELAEYEAEFRALWAEGDCSVSYAAQRLGTTRQQVIRTAHRLGLSQLAG